MANALAALLTEPEEARIAKINEALRISQSSPNPAARLSVLDAVMQNATHPVDVSHTLALADEMLELANDIRALFCSASTDPSRTPSSA